MTARHKFIKPTITCLLLEVSVQTLHLLLLPMLLYSAVIRGNNTAPRFSFGESTPLFSKDLSVRGHALFIPKAHFATQNATSFVTENCHYTTYKVPEGLFFFSSSCMPSRECLTLLAGLPFLCCLKPGINSQIAMPLFKCLITMLKWGENGNYYTT